MVAGPDPRPELIGRDEDLLALDAALEQARGGEPVTVLVAGEAGIGKTRLVEEFGERAFAAGARLLTGACVDLGDAAMPYGALMDALRGVPAEAFDALSETARNALAALVPEAAPDGDTDPATQGELFAALLRLLEHVGRQEPLVLVIEDLHWADRSTQDLLKFLVRGLRQAAVLVVLTYRTDEMGRDHPVPQLLTELRRAPRVHARVLGGLTREQLGRHLDTMAGRAVDAGTLDAIAARSEGNPFFAEELLAAQDGAGPIPASVGDALLVRLDRLSPPAQAVARVAAPLGHYVEHELLAAIAELPESTLDQAVRACVTGHVLVVDEGGRGYRFRHALLQEVAACELLPGERARVHHRVAELLESRPAGRGTAEAQRLAEIAHHRLRSDDSATALGAALRAARAAERVHALAEASRNYDATLRLWDRVAEPETIAQVDLAEVLDRAAECRWLGTGDAGGSAELLDRALAELDDAAPALRRADLTSRLAMTSWDAHANARAGLPLHEAALGMLDDAPSAIAARVRARFANTLLLLGDFPAAARHAADAVRTARAAGAPSEVADPLITLFVCRSFEGDDAGTVALMEEARGPVLETADARIVKRFFTNAITSLHNFGRYEEALALSAEGIELHNRAGLDYHGKMCMHANAADALCALGRPREAAALLGEADGTFTSDTLLVHLGHAQVALLEGRLEAAAARLERILEVRDVEAMLILPAATLAAEVALWRGDFATALNVLGDGEAAVCEDDWVAAASFFAVSVRAQADSAEGGALGDDTARAEADRVVQRLRQITRQAAVRVPEAHARGLLGEAERSRLDPYPDPAAWHAAAEAFDALGRPYEAAYAHWRHAQAVARAQGPRDELERAAGQAHAKAGAVGARHLVDAAERLARRARVRLPGMAQDAGDTFPDLTAREREVLALIADGRTNRQIAQELFITEKTASVHVSNILGKLGATNRGEAAALAHRAGFEPLPVAR